MILIRRINIILNLLIKKKDKEILKAGESIEQASNAVKSLINNISELNTILTPYLELSYDEFKDFHNNYKNLSKKSIQLDKQVKISTSELKDEVAFIKRLLEEADKFYDDALKYYNVKTYDKAKKVLLRQRINIMTLEWR